MPDELRDEGTNLDRLRNLSDGVFAIVLTLLVLNLQVPKLDQFKTDASLVQALRGLSHVFVGYVMSFLLIGAAWVVHHRIVRHIVRYDRRILLINLQHLFWLSLLPFTTVVLTTAPSLVTPWLIYATNMIMQGLTVVALWRSAVARGYVDSQVTPVLAGYLAARTWVTPVVFLISVPVAFHSPSLAHDCPALIVVAMVAIQRHYQGLAESQHATS